jgi:hypothetical protein
MSERKRLFLSLLVSAVVWVLFTWPLPRYVSTAIPYSAQVDNQEHISSMEPGDHLQYLYYLKLVTDMVTGRTPLMYNLYEFNTGDDAERFEPDPYYVPFSFLFALIAQAGNLALAWNLTGFISLWLTYWITWKLVRRYTENEWLAAAAAIMTFALPVRWANLLGGSPMGLAMLWPPVMMYGLDVAVRDGKWRGGILAGATILFALWTDLHTFFFSSLAAPLWCVVAFIKKENFEWNRFASYRQLAIALLPVPLFLIAALGIRHLHTQDKSLVAEESRKWSEAALFSPQPVGLLEHAQGITGHVYIGYGVIVLFAAGLIALLVAIPSRGKRSLVTREMLLLLVLAIGTAVLILLSLGAFGPNGGKTFDLARKYIPFYSMIRQSGKIYCLLPPILAVTSVVVFRLIWVSAGRWVSIGFWTVCSAWMLVDGYLHIGVGLTWFNAHQDAYAAVAQDAKTSQLRPGAIMIPLWPGDTHYTSVYQVYALEYKIRMINGYSPTVTSTYKQEIYFPFASINQGVVNEKQLDDLLARGIHYVLLHQNLFPEQVSPFPVGYTIRNLMNNPRLEFLKQDERVWSFRILEHPSRQSNKAVSNETFGSSIRMEVEHYARNLTIQTNDAGAGGMAFASFNGTNGWVFIKPFPVAKTPGLAWLLRARGHGVMRVRTGSLEDQPLEIPIASTDWQWYRIPIEQKLEIEPCGIKLEPLSGTMDADTLMLVGGSWKSPVPGESVEFEASRFFHGGFMNVETGTVQLEQHEDPIALIFYGPKLPFDAGVYDVELFFTTDAPDGTELGVINLEQDDHTGRGIPVNVIAGQPARGQVERHDNLPFKIVFVFHAKADMQIDRVVFNRIK